LAGWLERKGRWRSNLSARACCLPETGSTEGAACSCPFFDASVVRFPSSYSYAATYATRSLTPVAGYEHGTSMFTTIDISSTISSDNKYFGGVLGPNGRIYFVPYNADNIGILDPSTSSFSTLDISSSISSNNKYLGGVLGPNGLIYFVPRNADNKIGILDPSTSSFSTLDISSSISSTHKYFGGVLGPNGVIYFVPYYADNIGMLNVANKNPSYEAGSCMPEAWRSLLSPHFNKF